jgi:replicative DNA helicase
MLSDLRDSGSIEQDADVVLFLYRDDYYKNEDAGADKSVEICEVIIAKNRHGSTGSVKMGWIPQFTKFRTVADDNMPGAPS